MRLRRGAGFTPIAALVGTGSPTPGIGDPVDIGGFGITTGASTTLTFDTTADVTPDDTAIIAILSTNSKAITSVTDSAGNTWTLNTNVAPATNFLRQAFIKPASTIPLGTTITVTFAATLGRKMAQAVKCSGLNGHDVTGSGVDGTTTTPVVATPTLTQANDLLLASTYLNSGYLDTWTEDADWTAVPNSPVIDTRILRLAWKKSTGTASENYEPTNSASRAITSYVDSYKGA